MAQVDIVPVLSISLRGDFDLFLASGGWNLQDFMRYESLRLRSFARTSLQTSPLTLATCGFYVTRFGNEIRCFSCGIRHRGEEIPAHPASTPHSAGCLHEQGRDPRNVLFGSCHLPNFDAIFEDQSMLSGHLLWKIDNFKRKQEAALRDKFNYLESTPFYTSKRGYRICARIYLNGRNTGRSVNENLAVILFVILKGENDVSLAWPFRKRVTLSLLNQGRGENISDSFTPNPNSSVFLRPETQNVVFGCNVLIDLRDLNNPTKGFLINDSIVINVRVHD